MKSFFQLVNDQEQLKKRIVIAFEDMNPPNAYHAKLIEKVKTIAEKQDADHSIFVSGVRDCKLNPLSIQEKIKYLKSYSPNTNFQVTTKENKTLFDCSVKLYKEGYNEITIVISENKQKEFQTILEKHNNLQFEHGYYNFDKIKVISYENFVFGNKQVISESKMIEYAKTNNFNSLKEMVPSHIPDYQVRQLINDIRKGIGLNEKHNRGQFRAIFVTGGPGSGKDIVIREAIAESRIVELNLIQAKNYLTDKQKLSENSNDVKLQAIRSRSPLIINGPADDLESISYIKEELEELGYKTMMVFVNTSNDVSKERNKSLTKMMNESVRIQKWTNSQQNYKEYNQIFDNFILFDNSGDNLIKEETITKIYETTNLFLDSNLINESATDWLNRNSINKNISNIFKENKNVKTNNESDYKQNNGQRGCGKHRLLNDNNCPSCQMLRIAGKQDDVRYGDTKANSGGYTFRTYEETGPTLKVNPPAKVPKFRTDKNTEDLKKRGNNSNISGRIGTPDGLSPTFNDRGYGGAALGDQTYSESIEFSNASPASTTMPSGGSVNPLSGSFSEKKVFSKFRKIKKEAMDSPGEVASGLSGTLSGAGNTEKIVTYGDERRIAPNKKKINTR
jgi:predicted kinase